MAWRCPALRRILPHLSASLTSSPAGRGTDGGRGRPYEADEDEGAAGAAAPMTRMGDGDKAFRQPGG